MNPNAQAIFCWLWKHPRDGSRKLMLATGLRSSANVNWHLQRLNHQGYIKPGPGRTNCTRTLTGTGLLAAQGWYLLWMAQDFGDVG